MNRRLAPLPLVALLLLAGVGAPARGANAIPAVRAPGAEPLAAALAAEARTTARAARQLGIHVRDLETDAEVLAVAADEPRILASNTKLLTTAAALSAFGPGPLFETRLLARGVVSGGELAGDLAVIGDGDPNISGRQYDGDVYAVFRRWAQALAAHGIRRVTGELLLVNGLFPGPRVHPGWPRDQLTSWYSAPVDALTFNDNCVLVRVRPGKQPGDRARVEVQPRLGYFRILNEATTVATRQEARLFVGRAGERDTIVVRGTVAQGTGASEEWVAVADPPAYFGHALAAALAEEGIAVAGRPREVHGLPAGEWEEIARHQSDLLPTIAVTNKKSQNLYAELLLRTLGQRRAGEGSWEKGVQTVSEFLVGMGVPPGSFTLADGSGLARDNRMTPRAMTQLLAAMFASPHGREFVLSLPHSGEAGLRWERRLAEPPYRGNVFAKTGMIRGVSTLSGYVKGRSGKVYAFSILCNEIRGLAEAQRAQDRLLRVLVDRG